MILGFSTQINNRPTYFFERIWEGLLRFNFDTDIEYQLFLNAHHQQFGEYWDWFPDEHTRLTNTKGHTIREDKNNRWHAGTMIDFFINTRQKEMFRFAPVLPVVSVQKIEIKWFTFFDKKLVRVFIDDEQFESVKIDNSHLQTTGRMEEFAQQDGFDTVTEFFEYFNEDFKGKIIHWTDKRY